MKPENIKRVWEYYQGYKIRYRIYNSQYIIAAINKNIEGDFSPSRFYDSVESRVHLIVQQYIKYLLQQEVIEKAKEEEMAIIAQKEALLKSQYQREKQPQSPKSHSFAKRFSQEYNRLNNDGSIVINRIICYITKTIIQTGINILNLTSGPPLTNASLPVNHLISTPRPNSPPDCVIHHNYYHAERWYP